MKVDEIKWSLVRDAIRDVLFMELPDNVNDLEANALAGIMAELAAVAARLAVKKQQRGKEQACPPGTTA